MQYRFPGWFSAPQRGQYTGLKLSDRRGSLAVHVLVGRLGLTESRIA